MNSDLAKKIRNEIKKCEYSATVHLASFQLHEFPSKFLFTSSLLFDIRSSLKILNLSYNHLTVIPDSIGELTELKELWLQSNPLQILPISLSNCYKLEVLDLQRTQIQTIPSEFCNLKKLHELNYCDTPYALELHRRYQLTPTGLTGLRVLKEALENEFQRNCLKETILNKLLGELYMKEADDPNTKPIVERMVEQLNQEFTDLEEFRLFSRRADKLLPEAISQINEHTIPRTKEKFITMRDNTKRDRMAADVEIKLRSIYFDRIEREDVESTIRSIFLCVQSLEDMQFFVKYASQVLPTAPEDATGETIWRNILSLQEELINKRESAIRNLITAMVQLYPEQIPADVESRGRDVAQIFRKERFATKRELNSLSRLAADASQVFPPDFVSVTPKSVSEAMRVAFGRSAT